MLRHAAALRAARLLVFATFTSLAAGCSAATAGDERPRPMPREDRRDDDRGMRRREAASLDVPRGHLPPPGECRVWFPGRPPGRQPAPTSCRRAMDRAPAGSWVLYRPDRSEVHARVIDERREGVVVSVRVYDAATGRYLRNLRGERRR